MCLDVPRRYQKRAGHGHEEEDEVMITPAVFYLTHEDEDEDDLPNELWNVFGRRLLIRPLHVKARGHRTLGR